MLSYWEKQNWQAHADYTIIGAGIVGLFSAFFLKKALPKAKITVIERGVQPYGASTKNAGFACYGTAGEILDDMKSMNNDEIIDTVKLRWNGLQILKKTLTSQDIDLKTYGGYEVFQSLEDFEICADQLVRVNNLLQSATGLSQTLKIKEKSIGQLYHKSLYNPMEAQLNPVKLSGEMVRHCRKLGVDFLFGVEVEHIVPEAKRVIIKCKNSPSLDTHHAILATNAFTSELYQGLDLVPSRNQVLISDPIKEFTLKGTYHMDRGYVYFRNVGNRLLIGGARNIDSKEETTSELGSNPKIIEHLNQLATKVIGVTSFNMSHSWSGIIATGQSKQPIIKQVSDKITLAVRLGGMGVATGAAVAREVVNMITS